MFELRDILRQDAGVPDGGGTVLEDRYPDPPEGTNSVLHGDAAADGEVPFTAGPLVSIPGSPAPAPAPPAPGQLPTMTEGGVITQPAAAAAPPAATTAEMLAQGPATDFGYGTELNEDGQRVAVTPQRHQAMTDAGLEPGDSELTMRASTNAELDLDDAQKVLRLVDLLEGSDDVQDVYYNAEIPEDAYEAQA